MLVKYKNQKAKLHVMLPIGCKEKAASKGVLVFEAGKCLDLEDADALKLVAIDPNNFEVYDAEAEQEKLDAVKAVIEAKAKRKAERAAQGL